MQTANYSPWGSLLPLKVPKQTYTERHIWFFSDLIRNHIIVHTLLNDINDVTFISQTSVLLNDLAETSFLFSYSSSVHVKKLAQIMRIRTFSHEKVI